MTPRVYKVPDALVRRNARAPGVIVSRLQRPQEVALDEDDTRAWLAWDAQASSRHDRWLASGLAQVLPAPPSSLPASPCDDHRPTPSPDCKWYAETPDLSVLFHTGPMPRLNPLLVLGAYGSCVWHGLARGEPVRQIREQAASVFGLDRVTDVLARLAHVGVVRGFPPQPLPPLDGIEFHAPAIQSMIAQTRIPWYCLWELCTACNLRCRTCYLTDFRSAGAAREVAAQVADRIIESGIFYVALLGGEPLLHPEVHAMVRRFRNAGVFVKIITNGMSLDPDCARALAQAGLNQVEVSFDGLSSATHEMSRGETTFGAACRALATAREAGLPRVGMVLTVHSRTIHELPQLAAFMQAHGLAECYLSPFKKTGTLGGMAPWEPPDTTALGALRSQLGSWRREAPDLTIALLEECTCARSSAVIGPEGDLRACTFARLPAGNVLQTPLIDLWHAMARPAEDGPLGYCQRLRLGPAPTATTASDTSRPQRAP